MTFRFTDKSQLEHLSPELRAIVERELEAAQRDNAAAGVEPVTNVESSDRRGRPEQEAGRELIRWIDTLMDPRTVGRVGDYFAHNANGGARTAIEAAILIGQGVRPGWPDYTLYLPRGRWHGLVLELKATDGEKPAAEQLEILVRLERQGYKAVVAWGFEEARRAIEEYLGCAGA